MRHISTHLPTTCAGPFSLLPVLRQRLPPLTTRILAPAVDGALALSRLNAVYQTAASAAEVSGSFWDQALEALSVVIDVPAGDLTVIPRTGPLVVVANHPFGGLDGLALLSVLHRVRQDVRVFGNELLQRMPAIRETLIGVDAFGGPGSVRLNASALRQGLRWLRQGHTLAIFPAGEVSHYGFERRSVTDPRWHQTAARLAQLGGAAIVPLFFHGANSRLFHAAGLVHRRLRTLLLPREVLKRRGSVVRLSVGTPVPAPLVARFETTDGLTSYIRARTFVLRSRPCHPTVPRRPLTSPLSPLARAQSRSELGREVAMLSPDQRLIESAPYSVWLTTRAAAPRVVDEIGRLREMTFRLVREGTGRATDLDSFDDHYLHLFVWDDGRGEVVGAYRLGMTDQIVSRFGPAGLYTHTLFHLGAGFLDRITPALELGRSFVRPEYQREFAPLMLLWKGIGQIVMNNPQYSRLFGAVSISRDYATLSQQLLLTFLETTRKDHALAAFVTPRHLPAIRPWIADLPGFPRGLGQNGDRVDDLVREVERGERGMPVLLRQYLKLDAKVVGFDVDPGFGDVLDALMVVDLRTVDEAILSRYLGRAGASRFLAFHDHRIPRVGAWPSSPVIGPAPAPA